VTLDDGAVRRLLAVAGESRVVGDRYRLIERIGRGAMGEVWRAHDLKLDRDIALKIAADARDVDRARRRFEREAHDAGELEDGRPWYAMRLVPGTTLAGARTTLGSRNERLRVFAKLLEPVAHAHRAGFVHRDLKPENVMIGPSREVYVMDWGLAREVAHANDEAAALASAAGTPGFLAPEQAAGAAPEPQADVFALGGVLIELLGGDAASGVLPRDVPRPLAAIVAKARSQNPIARYADAAAFGDDIARWLDREPLVAYRENLGERLARGFERHRFLVLLIAGYLVLRVAVVFFVQN
jgi:eukaryotic-like serine/threonine-protein kinase